MLNKTLSGQYEVYKRIKTQHIYSSLDEVLQSLNLPSYAKYNNNLYQLVPLMNTTEHKLNQPSLNIPLSSLVYKRKNYRVIRIQTISILNYLYSYFAPTSQVLTLQDSNPNRRIYFGTRKYTYINTYTTETQDKLLHISIQDNIVTARGIKDA